MEITKEEIAASVVETGEVTVSEVRDFEVFYQTPAVRLVMDGKRVAGVIGKRADGSYVQFNAAKAVILATGDYTNNKAMVERWCPDIAEFDKKQFGKTGDGHLLAICAGAKMETSDIPR